MRNCASSKEIMIEESSNDRLGIREIHEGSFRARGSVESPQGLLSLFSCFPDYILIE
jgi:hypothetical protein